MRAFHALSQNELIFVFVNHLPFEHGNKDARVTAKKVRQETVKCGHFSLEFLLMVAEHWHVGLWTLGRRSGVVFLVHNGSLCVFLSIAQDSLGSPDQRVNVITAILKSCSRPFEIVYTKFPSASGKPAAQASQL